MVSPLATSVRRGSLPAVVTVVIFITINPLLGRVLMVEILTLCNAAASIEAGYRHNDVTIGAAPWE